MLRRGIQPFWKYFLRPRKLIIATAIVTYTLFKTHSLLSAASEPPETITPQKKKFKKRMDEYMKDMEELVVCRSDELREGRRKIVEVTDISGRIKKVMVFRVKGQLYACLGNCSHRDPLENDYT